MGTNDNSAKALIQFDQNTNADEAATNYGRPANNHGAQNQGGVGGYAYEPSELESVTNSVAPAGQDIAYGADDARKVDFNDPNAAKRRAQGKRKTAMPQQASFKGQRPEAMNFDQKRKTAATF